MGAKRPRLSSKRGGAVLFAPLLALLAEAGGAATSAATEYADTRAWATLPAQFRVARLLLPPGTHKVNVTYFASSGAVLSTQAFNDVVIRQGRRTYLHDRTAL